MLLVLLVQLFVLCWAGKPIDYTPLLRDLDDDIVHDVFAPKTSGLPPETRGQMLMNNVEKYNSRLIETRDMIQQNIYEAYIKARELKKIGGPQFLKQTIHEDKIKPFYEWSDADFNKLKKAFEITKENWGEIEVELAPAEVRFKQIHEEDAREKAEQAEREQKRIEELRKFEEEFNKRVTVNIGTDKDTN